ncbi:MAG: adenylate/guanylate cyclase domain-containing protein [Actinomycetota bacterium]|nr:adenylate/guanylate cyclase domain-containing protein [Actinomycetota bacterium]
MSDSPQTQFTRNGDVHIAFQTVGAGPLDILMVDTWVHHVEAVWDFPDFARFLRRLSSFGRLIHFDRRGTGLSDPVPLDKLPDVETQVEDALAVLDAADAQQPAVIGLHDGALLATILAANHPERCRSLVLFPAVAKHHLAAGMPMEVIDQVLEEMTHNQATGRSGVEILAPSRANDERFSQNLSRLQRYSVRPGAIAHFFRQTMLSDVGNVLPAIRVPTLILNRTGNPIVAMELSREAASQIPLAKLVELPGTDHLAYSQDIDAVLDEIEEFLTGARTGADPDRILATLLFTDIVDSTTRAAQIGDRRWRDLLDQHHRVVRGQLERFRGREIGTAGDGFFATFNGPGQAVRCALAITQAVSSLGLEVRAGVHTGEVEVHGSDLGGLAVHIAARISGLARGSEVLVSTTVKDLLAGSSIYFEERGDHELKGVPGAWRLFAAYLERA